MDILFRVVLFIVFVLYIGVGIKNNKKRGVTNLTLSSYFRTGGLRLDQKGSKAILYFYFIILCIMLVGALTMSIINIGIMGYIIIAVLLAGVFQVRSIIDNFDLIKKEQQEGMHNLRMAKIEEMDNN